MGSKGTISTTDVDVDHRQPSSELRPSLQLRRGHPRLTCVSERRTPELKALSAWRVRTRRALAMQNKRMTLVGAGLTVCSVRSAASALEQDGSFGAARI